MAQTTQTKDPSFSPDWRFQEPVAWRDTDLDENILTEWFHYMLLGRQIDYRFQVLNRQGRAPFIISCAGHEAAQIGVSWPLKPKYDWLAPYYRDVVLCMRMGMTPLDLMLSVLAKSSDPASGGKQTPGHFSDARLNITSGGSPVATQMVRAAGGGLRLSRSDRRRPRSGHLLRRRQGGRRPGARRWWSDVDRVPRRPPRRPLLRGRPAALPDPGRDRNARGERLPRAIQEAADRRGSAHRQAGRRARGRRQGRGHHGDQDWHGRGGPSA